MRRELLRRHRQISMTEFARAARALRAEGSHVGRDSGIAVDRGNKDLGNAWETPGSRKILHGLEPVQDDIRENCQQHRRSVPAMAEEAISLDRGVHGKGQRAVVHVIQCDKAKCLQNRVCRDLPRMQHFRHAMHRA